jgi:hypothetical protein
MAFSSFQFGWVEMSRFDLAAQSEDPDRRDRFWHDLEQQMERNDLMTLPTKQTQRLRLGGETLFLCVNSHRGSYTPFKKLQEKHGLWADERVVGCFKNESHPRVCIVLAACFSGTLVFNIEREGNFLQLFNPLQGDYLMTLDYQPRLMVWDLLLKILNQMDAMDRERYTSKVIKICFGEVWLSPDLWSENCEFVFDKKAASVVELPLGAPADENVKGHHKKEKIGQCHKRPAKNTDNKKKDRKVLKRPAKK